MASLLTFADFGAKILFCFFKEKFKHVFILFFLPHFHGPVPQLKESLALFNKIIFY